MQSVIIADFGSVLGRTSERLVVRGPRPRPDRWKAAHRAERRALTVRHGGYYYCITMMHDMMQ